MATYEFICENPAQFSAADYFPKALAQLKDESCNLRTWASLSLKFVRAKWKNNEMVFKFTADDKVYIPYFGLGVNCNVLLSLLVFDEHLMDEKTLERQNATKSAELSLRKSGLGVLAARLKVLKDEDWVNVGKESTTSSSDKEAKICPRFEKAFEELTLYLNTEEKVATLTLETEALVREIFVKAIEKICEERSESSIRSELKQ